MKKIQVIKVKNWGDEWLNRLAVIEDRFGKMGATERKATMNWLIAKYATVHHA
jgi:hypothetical protein